MSAATPPSATHRPLTRPGVRYLHCCGIDANRLLITVQVPGGITNDRNAAMGYSPRAYMKNVVQRYRVRIEGWPLNEVPFRNLSDVSNLPKLELLLRGWKEGTIRLAPITEAQYAAMVADPSPWIGSPEAADAESED